MDRNSPFDQFSKSVSRSAGHPAVFACALLLILLWIISGPVVGFSDTWQLVINTATTIITFLMVFVIQNTQNRDGAAIQIKLDEIIRAVEGAHNGLLDLEELSEEELENFRKQYLELADEARSELRSDTDTGTPAVTLRRDESIAQ